MLTLADAMLLVIQARRRRIVVKGLAGTAVKLYHELINLADLKPKTAQDIVDWYLA